MGIEKKLDGRQIFYEYIYKSSQKIQKNNYLSNEIKNTINDCLKMMEYSDRVNYKYNFYTHAFEFQIITITILTTSKINQIWRDQIVNVFIKTIFNHSIFLPVSEEGKNLNKYLYSKIDHVSDNNCSIDDYIQNGPHTFDKSSFETKKTGIPSLDKFIEKIKNKTYLSSEEKQEKKEKEEQQKIIEQKELELRVGEITENIDYEKIKTNAVEQETKKKLEFYPQNLIDRVVHDYVLKKLNEDQEEIKEKAETIVSTEIDIRIKKSLESIMNDVFSFLKNKK